MIGNWYQTSNSVCLNLIANNYFGDGYLCYVIDYTNFVRDFVNFFYLMIYLCSGNYRVIDFVNDLSYLVVVFGYLVSRGTGTMNVFV